jgi:heptose I phosphotransferase
MHWLNLEMRRCFGSQDVFKSVFECEGLTVRNKERRRTFRFEFENRAYYAKVHNGIGWLEIFKNLSRFSLPVVDASSEWKAIDRLSDRGIKTAEVVGYGARGFNPARRESFIVMRELSEQVELEDFLVTFGGLVGKNRYLLKRQLIRSVAKIARSMHEAGINHRDFYLCHFQIQDRDWLNWSPGQQVEVSLLDLHRAQRRSKVPARWLVKDLGALLYSSIDGVLTFKDMVLFLKDYSDEHWRDFLKHRSKLCHQIFKRADAFYRKHRGKPPGWHASITKRLPI